MAEDFKRAPDYAPIPLTGRELRVGGRDVPFVEELDVRGTEGLGPFPATPPCPPERVPQRQFPTPNNPLLEERGLQIFSQWSELIDDTEADPQTPAFQPYTFLRSPISWAKGDLGEMVEGDKSVSKLWVIDLWAYEVARLVLLGEGPVTPLSSARIIDNTIEVGSQMTRLKARLNLHSASGGTTRIVDIAEGIRMTVEAWQVSVEVLYPQPGTQQVANNDRISLAPNGGLVLDTVVGGFITETTSPPGIQATSNTITLRVAPGEADARVFVPPGVRSVDIYQTGAGSLMVLEWRLLRQAAGTGPSLGTIILGGNRRVQDLERPGSAGMITTGPADQGIERVVTFIFRGEI